MSKLTDEQIRKLQAIENLDILNCQYEPYKFARAIESAATEPLLQRIAELEKECSEWKNDAINGLNAAYLRGRVKELERQLEEARKDAERYRWLRRWKGQEHEPPFTVQHELDGTLWGGDLDAAIDAAMKEQK